MGSDDRDGNRLIKANFTADGAAKLKESVMEKLKEFMGDYSDDTLVVRMKILIYLVNLFLRERSRACRGFARLRI